MTWKQFWGICEHKWIRLNKITVNTDFGGVYHKWVLECEKCGEVKSKRV